MNPITEPNTNRYASASHASVLACAGAAARRGRARRRAATAPPVSICIAGRIERTRARRRCPWCRRDEQRAERPRDRCEHHEHDVDRARPRATGHPSAPRRRRSRCTSDSHSRAVGRVAEERGRARRPTAASSRTRPRRRPTTPRCSAIATNPLPPTNSSVADRQHAQPVAARRAASRRARSATASSIVPAPSEPHARHQQRRQLDDRDPHREIGAAPDQVDRGKPAQRGSAARARRSVTGFTAP